MSHQCLSVALHVEWEEDTQHATQLLELLHAVL